MVKPNFLFPLFFIVPSSCREPVSCWVPQTHPESQLKWLEYNPQKSLPAVSKKIKKIKVRTLYTLQINAVHEHPMFHEEVWK